MQTSGNSLDLWEKGGMPLTAGHEQLVRGILPCSKENWDPMSSRYSQLISRGPRLALAYFSFLGAKTCSQKGLIDTSKNGNASPK